MHNSADLEFMSRALTLARKAYDLDEVPVGAVIVKDREVIAEACNMREHALDPVAHAEILAIQGASRMLQNWRLTGVTIYVTKEPCIMCCGGILHARIQRVVYGCRDDKGGGAESLYSLLNDRRLNHRAEVVGGVLEAECSELLKSFFRDKRV